MALLYHPGMDTTRLYYGTDTHAQCLLVGASLAVVAGHDRRAPPGPRHGARRGSRGRPGGDPAWAATTLAGRSVLLPSSAGRGRRVRPCCGGGSHRHRLVSLRGRVLVGRAGHRGGAGLGGLRPAVSGGRRPVDRPAPLPGSHLLRHVPVALPALQWIDGTRTGLTGLPAVRRPGGRHRGGGHRLLLPRRAADPPGLRSSGSGGPGWPRRSAVVRDRGRPGGGHHRAGRCPPWPGRATTTTTVPGRRRRAAGQGARHRGLDRVDPRDQPERRRQDVRPDSEGRGRRRLRGDGRHARQDDRRRRQRLERLQLAGRAGHAAVPVHASVRKRDPVTGRRAVDSVGPRLGATSSTRTSSSCWRVGGRCAHGSTTASGRTSTSPTSRPTSSGSSPTPSRFASAKGAKVVLLTAPCYDPVSSRTANRGRQTRRPRLDAYNRLVNEVAAENPTKASAVDLDAMVCPERPVRAGHRRRPGAEHRRGPLPRDRGCRAVPRPEDPADPRADRPGADGQLAEASTGRRDDGTPRRSAPVSGGPLPGPPGCRYPLSGRVDGVG